MKFFIDTANVAEIRQAAAMGVLDGAPVVSYYDRTKGALAFSVGTIGDDGVSWEEERVALTSRQDAADALGAPASDWVVLYLEDVVGDPREVLLALKANEEK